MTTQELNFDQVNIEKITGEHGAKSLVVYASDKENEDKVFHVHVPIERLWLQVSCFLLGGQRFDEMMEEHAQAKIEHDLQRSET